MDAISVIKDVKIPHVLKILTAVEQAVADDLKRQGLPVNVEIVRRRTSDAVALFTAIYPNS